MTGGDIDGPTLVDGERAVPPAPASRQRKGAHLVLVANDTGAAPAFGVDDLLLRTSRPNSPAENEALLKAYGYHAAYGYRPLTSGVPAGATPNTIADHPNEA